MPLLHQITGKNYQAYRFFNFGDVNFFYIIHTRKFYIFFNRKMRICPGEFVQHVERISHVCIVTEKEP
jgi:hypothetical protein